MIYRFGFYRGGPVLMSALAGVSDSRLLLSCMRFRWAENEGTEADKIA